MIKLNVSGDRFRLSFDILYRVGVGRVACTGKAVEIDASHLVMAGRI
jgi:hypothetical protein